MPLGSKFFKVIVNKLCELNKCDINDLPIHEKLKTALKSTINPIESENLSVRDVALIADKFGVSLDYLTRNQIEWEEDIHKDFENLKSIEEKLFCINEHGLPYNYPDIAVFYFKQFKDKLLYPIVVNDEKGFPHKLVSFGGNNKTNKPAIKKNMLK